MARKQFVEFMGLKLDLSKTKNKVHYERKFGSPMKEVFKLMSMVEVIEAIQEENTENIDYEKIDMMSLDFMVNLIHASAQRFNANVNIDVIYDLVDLYLEQNTVFDLMSVTMEILEQAGYLNFDNEEE